jgi:hypothetical protein
MRLYGAIQKVEPRDDGTVRVHGIASSEVVDDQGEIVRADAMRCAIPDYMRFPALREMHQLSAAGTTLEAEVGDDGTTRIVAHVVDPVAVSKVKNQVYRGFSIGGRVTQREAGNPKAITGLVLNEISLVDRPANPAAVFDCWKAATLPDALRDEAETPLTMTAPREREPFNPPLGLASRGPTATLRRFSPEASLRSEPVQIWACGMPDHHHRAKGEAVKCLEKQAAGAVDLGAAPSPQASLATSLEDRLVAVSANGTEAAIDAAKKAIETAEGALAKSEDRKSPDASSTSPIAQDAADYADPGYQPDGKPRYPVDTERHIRAAWSYINKPGNARRYTTDQLRRIRAAIIAAWKERIDIGGPPSAEDNEDASADALTKALSDVGQVARIILDLDWLRDALEVEAVMEADDSPQPAHLQAILTELCSFLNGLVAEETCEILDDASIDGEAFAQRAAKSLATAAGVRGTARLAALLKTGNPKMRKLAADLVAKAKHSQGDQALADLALYACDKCIEMDGLSALEKTHVAAARDHLFEAGAVPSTASTVAAAGNIGTVDTSKGPEEIPIPRSQPGRANRNLMDVAHQCISMLTDGMVCADPAAAPDESADAKDVAKAGARHCTETMGHLGAAHGHLVAAGAECNGAGFREEEHQGTEFESMKTIRTGNLAKVLADERAEKAALVKALGEMVPLLDRLSQRVDDIARTPLPPLTIAKGSVSLSKEQDSGGAGTVGSQLSSEAIASALAKMSKEEQTLTLIKASYAKPIRVLGVAPGEH